MLSTVKERFIQVMDLIPGLLSRQNAMTEAPKFKATDSFEGRYVDKEVLRKALVGLGFKDTEIKIQATETKGLDVELPKEITKEQKASINKQFVDAKNRPPPKEADDEDD
ncbi:hypothetical protein HD806DRAFT_379832 [Xylariaceae sp. AK1471]|nr:hypothetical protein HD806DRAFT_379832 [Xylariaceae sp. AK1471]